MLNRAKIVLSNSKLRREYDLLGLDLDDDAEDEEDEDGGGGGGGDADEEAEETAAEIPQEEGDDAIHCTDHNGNDESAKRDTNEGTHRRRPTKSPAAKTYVGGTRSGKQHEKDNNNKSNGNNGGGGGGGSKTETVMGHLASASLAAVLQVVVRTGLMSVVSVLISRYVILVSRVVVSRDAPFSRFGSFVPLCVFFPLLDVMRACMNCGNEDDVGVKIMVKCIVLPRFQLYSFSLFLILLSEIR